MVFVILDTYKRQGGNEDDGDEGIKDLIDLTLRKMDLDRDGRVSFDDFRYEGSRQI